MHPQPQEPCNVSLCCAEPVVCSSGLDGLGELCIC